MDSDYERKVKELGGRIDFLRAMSLLFLLLSVVLVVLVFFLTDVLSYDLKVWMVSVCGCTVLGLAVALFLSRKDATTSLFVIFPTTFCAGVLMGIGIFAVAYQIKRH